MVCDDGLLTAQNAFTLQVLQKRVLRQWLTQRRKCCLYFRLLTKSVVQTRDLSTESSAAKQAILL